jgi:hypothetical protein
MTQLTFYEMKFTLRSSTMNSKTFSRLLTCCVRSLFIVGLYALSVLIVDAARAPQSSRTFANPNEAAEALATAAQTADHSALRAIFGPGVDGIMAPDPVQAKEELKQFSDSIQQFHHVVNRSQNESVLEFGKDHTPFPVPIVKSDNGWYFDTDAGKEEILNRRIGRNELNALTSVRAYVEAQREYASRDRNNDQVLEYAQKLVSSPGKKDGLYWPSDLDGELSPLGPYFANAQSKGYLKKEAGPDATPEPFQGYYFKILTRQGKGAPGGKYDYVINGHMIGGFALIAYPADYGESGIMTFIVNQTGKVYQKDLGPKTDKVAPEIEEYDLDKTWKLSPD